MQASVADVAATAASYNRSAGQAAAWTEVQSPVLQHQPNTSTSAVQSTSAADGALEPAPSLATCKSEPETQTWQGSSHEANSQAQTGDTQTLLKDILAEHQVQREQWKKEMDAQRDEWKREKEALVKANSGCNTGGWGELLGDGLLGGSAQLELHGTSEHPVHAEERARREEAERTQPKASAAPFSDARQRQNPAPTWLAAAATQDSSEMHAATSPEMQLLQFLRQQAARCADGANQGATS